MIMGLIGEVSWNLREWFGREEMVPDILAAAGL
jgi:hypothetical protein